MKSKSSINMRAIFIYIVSSLILSLLPASGYAYHNTISDVADSSECYLSVPDVQLIRNRRGDIVDRKAWRQHKVLKATAWSCCGLGVMSLAGSLLWATIDYGSNGKQKNRNGESALAATGIVLTVGSIPLFCISHYKKKKSYSLSLHVEQVPTKFMDVGLQYSNSVGLCLNL